MSFEIERKFLVTGDFKSQAYSSSRIRQGYISTVGKATVRVRIRGDKGYLTIKGRSNEAGISRYEFETEVPLQDAEDLMRLCEPGVIDKTRYLVRQRPPGRGGAGRKVPAHHIRRNPDLQPGNMRYGAGVWCPGKHTLCGHKDD